MKRRKLKFETSSSSKSIQSFVFFESSQIYNQGKLAIRNFNSKGKKKVQGIVKSSSQVEKAFSIKFDSFLFCQIACRSEKWS